MNHIMNAVAAPAQTLSTLVEIRCGIARINDAHENLIVRLNALASRLDRSRGIHKDAAADNMDPAQTHHGELPVMKDMVDYSEQKIGDIYSLIYDLEALL